MNAVPGKEARGRPSLSRLARRLEDVRRRKILAKGLGATASAMACHALCLPVFGWLFFLHPYDRVWERALLASYLAYAWPLVALFMAWKRGQWNRSGLAAELDAANPGSPDVFRTLLSLNNHRPETLDALDGYYARIENGLHLPGLKWRPRPWGLLACVAAGAVLPVFSGHYAEVAYRMLLPVSAWKQRLIPDLRPSHIPDRIALGDTLRAQVRFTRLPPGETVYGRIGTQGRELRFPLDRNGDSAVFVFGPAQGNLAVSFSAAGAETREYRVRAVAPPHLGSFSAVVSPPAYTHAPRETIPEMPQVLPVLRGSALAFAAAPSEPLRMAQIEFRSEGAAPETLVLDGVSGANFHFARLIRKSCEIRGRLVAQDGVTGFAGPYRVEASEDAAPEIALVTPESDQALGRAMKVPVVFRAQDDFGISRVKLVYSVWGDGLKSQGNQNVTEWLTGGLGGGVWDLGGLDLYPGNFVEMHLEASDNDAISGPKTSRSLSVRLRMPSLEEVLAQVAAEENEAATSLRSAVEREERTRKQAEQSGKPMNPEGPPPPGEWEVERVLSLQPREHLQRVRRHLDAEAARAGLNTPLGRELRGLTREAEQMEKRLPPPDITRRPLPEQRKSLEALTRDQERLKRGLEMLKPVPPPGPEASRDRLPEDRKRLKEDLERNLREQEDLRSWFQDQERQRAEAAKRSEQSAQADQRVREDVQKAMDQMQKAMDKAAENGVLSPDLLEKMERVRELLKEALPDSVRQKMEKAATNQDVGMEDVQENLKKMLERGDGLRESLDRAIRMLETLRKIRGLENLARAFRDLEQEEKELAGRIPKEGDPAHAASRQAELRRQLAKTRQELEKAASEERAFQKVKEQTKGREADQAMRDAESKIQSGSKSAAAQSANQAAASLGQSAQAIDDFLQSLEGGPDPSEIAAALEESFEFSGWLELMAQRQNRVAAGWGESDAALLQRGSQLAQWLRNRWLQLAAKQPFESEALRREASALGFHGETLVKSGMRGMDSLLVHARKAERELLKWLAQSKQAGSSSGGGSGSGTSQSGGSGEEGGMEGAAKRLRGVSGRQMAVNQATQELLRSYLQGRRPGNQSGGSQTGGESGPEGSSQASKPGNGAAGGQQQVGEALEKMAESESDAGGAARKLRKLAEEARGLEKALREGRIGGEEMKQRQDRFQSRLLEAANALEERGRDRKREAEAFRGDLKSAAVSEGAAPPDLFGELKRRRAWARALNLNPDQKRHVEWYYESLLKR